jgi:hypothetical protein
VPLACEKRKLSNEQTGRAGKSAQAYALRACHVRYSPGSKPALASCSQVPAGGCRWMLMAVRGHLGDMRQYRCSGESTINIRMAFDARCAR